MQHAFHEAFFPRRFGPLPPEVSQLVKLKMFGKGSIIVQQGEPAQHFYYVHSGQVKASILRHDGTEKVVAFAEPGQFFADVPFFQQVNHWYTCEAMESTQVSEFSQAMMEMIMRARPDFVLTLMQSMAHKVWMLSNQMMSLTFDPFEVRLARILLEILRWRPKGTRSLSITHQELSSLVGTSRVMVTRVLNEWRERGIVQMRKGEVCIIDMPALERTAELGAE
ncbi:Crp/Fnr family transcriptional regulator [Paenibacillus tyrfis]|uniref:Crp/Fnr family transcriptional regulator n=1 Tax=Paenibacillus tyrfis TaxID=1501230 RepID=UPI000B58B7ED|nr:Crp/Fnr family transcriptional regulator [Paenibacillus tyrfis]